ncbi:hypothetical protein QO002_005310 [Pararhizobium capsulatum DSM 1112]|uniref:Uncharacterized protein n=1 Tax=Pararhizobium capsulatum DSM 1112 TaxID=1121113 RepID=A0ABU0BXX6_9HYPH|nr:hypothetical protein [Pararhizobium capsulatum]MDQ0323104.1 hypothetical protein [Pararhizobium capsulatum DSM 1112]
MTNELDRTILELKASCATPIRTNAARLKPNSNWQRLNGRLS